MLFLVLLPSAAAQDCIHAHTHTHPPTHTHSLSVCLFFSRTHTHTTHSLSLSVSLSLSLSVSLCLSLSLSVSLCLSLSLSVSLIHTHTYIHTYTHTSPACKAVSWQTRPARLQRHERSKGDKKSVATSCVNVLPPVQMTRVIHVKLGMRQRLASFSFLTETLSPPPSTYSDLPLCTHYIP
jgi:hypothetical protein